jgi:GNAT superfamily N-acetyltransferase
MRQDDLIAAESRRRTAEIRPALSRDDVERARALFHEYASSLGVDLCFQGFDRELARLPGAYAPPGGRLLLAADEAGAFGCVALRALDESSKTPGGTATLAEPRCAEVKRLYVKPARRGEGWGERLARAIVDEARAIGYRELKLDTLAGMSAARALYARLGFRQCAAYYDNPLAGAVYLSLVLVRGAEPGA